MSNRCICLFFMHIFTARRLYKSFCVKGLKSICLRLPVCSESVTFPSCLNKGELAKPGGISRGFHPQSATHASRNAIERGRTVIKPHRFCRETTSSQPLCSGMSAMLRHTMLSGKPKHDQLQIARLCETSTH
jgi:hypothetical protein